AIFRKYSVAFLLLIMLSGFLRYEITIHQKETSVIRALNMHQIIFYVDSVERDSFSDKKYSVKIIINNKINGKALLTRSTATMKLTPGSFYLLKSIKLRPIKTGKNADSYQQYLSRNGYSYIGRISKKTTIIEIPGKNIPFTISMMRKLQQFRLELADKNLYKLGIRKGSLINGLLLGLKKEIPLSIVDTFKNMGLSHLLAVSGLHVGFLILILYQFVNILPIHKVFRIILLIVSIFSYAALTGFSASVIRTTLMASMIFFATIINRNYHSINALSAAALLQLFINPDMIFDVGFQLSFSAVGGIILFYPIIRSKIPLNLSAPLYYSLEVLSVSTAASLATAPITLWYFSTIPAFGLILNIFVIPLTFILVGLGVLISLPFPFPLSLIFTYSCDLMSGLYLSLLNTINNFDIWILIIPENMPGLKIILFTILAFFTMAITIYQLKR
ncbi:MAG: ComEC/Rec2 family competence protein, partial [Candidatus Marinimicrobia bacterium]|nr:ComEC/Rec2 family competence protein [Candidatus Neomarinimicrobiota bacterium]